MLFVSFERTVFELGAELIVVFEICVFGGRKIQRYDNWCLRVPPKLGLGTSSPIKNHFGLSILYQNTEVNFVLGLSKIFSKISVVLLTQPFLESCYMDIVVDSRSKNIYQLLPARFNESSQSALFSKI